MDLALLGVLGVLGASLLPFGVRPLRPEFGKHLQCPDRNVERQRAEEPFRQEIPGNRIAAELAFEHFAPQQKRVHTNREHHPRSRHDEEFERFHAADILPATRTNA